MLFQKKAMFDKVRPAFPSQDSLFSVSHFWFCDGYKQNTYRECFEMGHRASWQGLHPVQPGTLSEYMRDLIEVLIAFPCKNLCRISSIFCHGSGFSLDESKSCAEALDLEKVYFSANSASSCSS